jgi:hypothetical protein
MHRCALLAGCASLTAFDRIARATDRLATVVVDHVPEHVALRHVAIPVVGRGSETVVQVGMRVELLSNVGVAFVSYRRVERIRTGGSASARCPERGGAPVQKQSST